MRGKVLKFEKMVLSGTAFQVRTKLYGLVGPRFGEKAWG